MRIADYIFKTLADKGVKHVFLVTGGGAMHLNDAVGRESRIRYICNLHEQACAMAAEGYARITGTPGVLNVTTGPGGTNAITGVAGAWLDSIPMLVISGQVKRATTISACPELQLRQLGDQELNIVDVVRPITKYAVMVQDPAMIRYELEKAWHLCQCGRPGPVWLDIPLDIQAYDIDTDTLPSYTPSPADVPPEISEIQLEEIAAKLRSAKRPAIIAGIGVRHAQAAQQLLEAAEKCRIPVLTSISGADLIPSNHPFFFGRPGILGERAANFIMQNSDLLLVLGTRMGIRVIGYAYDKIAREACKIMVDADKNELQKPTFRPDIAVHGDAGKFLKRLLPRLEAQENDTVWLDYCRNMKNRYPVITEEHRAKTDHVSSYVLPELLSRFCREKTIVVTGNGIAYTSTFQAIPLKPGMRLFANEACASMGYGLPAAIGASLAGNGREVLCITGDGSLQMNIQELQTMKNLQLPIKLFVYNNDGYLSIKLTQKSFFDGHFVGSHPASGVSLPDLEKIAAAYGLPFRRLCSNQEAETMLPEILAASGPVLIEVMLDPFEIPEPKAASKQLPDGSMVSAPLEDLSPFLPREEFLQNMIVQPVKEVF
ncbi:MAG: thiamine pyrophosphate-binding protein [Lentisphaeria bacterium]|nr:thiamine pyrophosphate-binding protein [Lentisphaeria bacterium]